MKRRLLAILSALALLAGLSLAAAQPAQATSTVSKTRTTSCNLEYPQRNTNFVYDNGSLDPTRMGKYTIKVKYNQYFDGTNYFMHPGDALNPTANPQLYVKNNSDVFLHVDKIEWEKRNQADTGWDQLFRQDNLDIWNPAWVHPNSHNMLDTPYNVHSYPAPIYWGSWGIYYYSNIPQIVFSTDSFYSLTNFPSNDPNNNYMHRWAWKDQQPKFIVTVTYWISNVHYQTSCWVPLDGIDNP